VKWNLGITETPVEQKLDFRDFVRWSESTKGNHIFSLLGNHSHFNKVGVASVRIEN
jgi:hypothetical protein